MEGELFPQSTSFGRDTRSQNFDFFFAVASGCASMVTRTDRDACLRKSVDTHDGLGIGLGVTGWVVFWLCEESWGIYLRRDLRQLVRQIGEILQTRGLGGEIRR